MTDIETDAWQAVLSAHSGHIFADWEQGGVRVLVMRGPSSLCAYVGVPCSHPWWGKGYDDVEVECHGGLTFSDDGDGKCWPKGWWWFGWDYGHAFDYFCFYDEIAVLKGRHPSPYFTEHKWTVPEVEAEARDVAAQFVAAVEES